MADKDKDLTHLFVRDLDDIPLPPHNKWRPAPRKESQLMKTSRYVLYAGAIAAVLVIALIASFQLRDSNPVAASPSPSASTSSPIPASSAPSIPSPVPTASTTQSPSPTAVGFALPSGCAYAGSPVVGTDGSQWKFDCGSAANHDARGTLAPAFAAQGWSGCAVGLGSGTWMKGDLRLIVTEGSGAAAPAGLPTLTQPARGIQTACG